MRYLAIVAAAAAALAATPALAQDETGSAPDGTPAFGIKPYVGVMGGYHVFDSDGRGQLSSNCGSRGCPEGAFVEGVAGVNVPLAFGFIGAEGNVSKDFGDLDWEYGVYGRFGVRAGDSGIVYGKVGYQWVDTDTQGKDDKVSYGAGVEVGPKSIGLGGITGNAGVRLRLEASTFDFQSFRPAAGVIFHF